MTMVSSPTTGMERIAREALIVLIDTLNIELEHQETLWVPSDEELSAKRGIDYEPISIEPVAPENFYPGHKPSLVNAAIDRYPNVAVDSDQVGASGSDSIDQASTYGVSLFVEFMAKSEKSEEEVSARAHRMLDAINICIMSNRDLRGSIQELDGSPTGILSDVFVRKEKTSHGPMWFWRGGRIEYVPKKVAQMPSGPFLRSASVSGIDQT